ncbi:PD-(D/E)XK motif protein [Pseudomonas alabamensis]|uniref:PD-(D/E)XK motif protein n=1 Tax=Pseudomonas alabamensis TaxID=3064349 RepID=UPI0011A014CA
MAAVNNENILSTWRALNSSLLTPGWRSIDAFQAGKCQIKLARHSPSGDEAMLVGFSIGRLAPAIKLPKGQGFRMERAYLGKASEDREWLAIVKQPLGSLELFASVVVDITRLLVEAAALPENQLYQQLIGRVRGWQEFMRKGHEGLSKEAEQGLVGELCFLDYLLNANVLAYTVMESWKGPAGGLHDFLIGTGSIEVKSTIATEGFPVRIASLNQLDDSMSCPLFLAGIRLEASANGVTLPEQVKVLRARLANDSAALNLFEKALLDVGYLEIHTDTYIRKLLPKELRLLLVDADFPRLIPFNVPPALSWAQYELDLCLVVAEELSLPQVLETLGVI